MNPELLIAAQKDFGKRAYAGSYIYLIIWLLIAFACNSIDPGSELFIFNTLLFVLTCIARLALTVKITHSDRPDQYYQALIILILFNATHWSFLSSWLLVYYPTLLHEETGMDINAVLIIILTGFAVGGSVIFSISRVMSIAYPLIMFVPAFIAGVIIGHDDLLLLFLLALFTTFYVYVSTRAAHNDYWSSLYNRHLAEERAEELEKISILDPLTKLHTRSHFNSVLEMEWARCRRNKACLSLMIIDLDHYKLINDNYGHLAGDECLRQVSNILKQTIKRNTDTIARFGGDEFVIILPDTEEKTAVNFAQTLIYEIKQSPFVFRDKQEKVTCSIGIASMIPDDKHNQDYLFHQADSALYEAKSKGRDQYHIAEHQ